MTPSTESRNPSICQPMWALFENNYFKEMCSGSEACSYVVYHSTLGLRVITKKKKKKARAFHFSQQRRTPHFSLEKIRRKVMHPCGTQQNDTKHISGQGFQNNVGVRKNFP